MRKKILVHCCCGPCATSSIQRLLDEGYEVVLCYGNSNIWPEEENNLRYENLLKVSEYFGGLEVVRQSYDHELWRDFVRGLENEPEHGKRCLKCFEFNLRAAYEEAQRLGIESFTTTLTVSRFKNSPSVFSAGSKFDTFEQIDFKKKDGFAKSCKMAKALGLYRQQYCGCEFSLPEGDAENA
ncbi:MAG: epoxyqueuosine reductase QueH [Sphaerochaeta sp.]